MLFVTARRRVVCNKIGKTRATLLVEPGFAGVVSFRVANCMIHNWQFVSRVAQPRLGDVRRSSSPQTDITAPKDMITFHYES
jgi:hypothetical protein